MPETEASLEKTLIDSLTQGISQWTYREDLKTEEDLWNNIRQKLIANNRDKLAEGNEPYLTHQEFEQVKNQLSFSSFYRAGVFLSGANGQVRVTVKRGVKTLDLLLFDRNANCGGTTSYEVINQFQTNADDKLDTRSRRFDVTLLFNGLPLIHIELKNGFAAGYSDGFWQIKKYIDEGRFKGVFSMVQMFVVSNGADTRYFAASDKPNFEFLTNWSMNNKECTAVNRLTQFSKEVLKIPEAHKMITDYLILDKKKESIILLRPYQIHAIEAIKKASIEHKSGYIWHTTGSGKTLTSYKVARNLIIDLKSVDKTIFLIDRKNLDDKTTDDFKAYAENDSIIVDDTDNTGDLEKKLLSEDRTMIVTTIQKLQRLLRTYDEGATDKIKSNSEKAKNKKVVFVVDECHRTVTKKTKAEFDRFFRFPLWYGFTGTPIFDENQGTLDATTQELYGERLHTYTIKNALRDKAVLKFQVEYQGPKNDTNDLSVYSARKHLIEVVRTIVEQSAGKFGIKNPIGKTYDAILSTGSIPKAQQYYDLFKEIKEGKVPEVSIPKEIMDKYPDFPKVAITYSLQENKEDSERNSKALGQDIEDYNKMFGTSFRSDTYSIEAYNKDLADRLARKGDRYLAREEQLDLVIVADRLLTGFDAPCLSTVFLDRQPQTPHNMIQTFSRTNRIYDDAKQAGYIVTFQCPEIYKEKVEAAIKLFTEGGTEALAPCWEFVFKEFKAAVDGLLRLTPHPDDVDTLGPKEKKLFCKKMQELDRTYHAVQCYVEWYGHKLSEFGISEEDYQLFVGKYKDLMDEWRKDRKASEDEASQTEEGEEYDPNYELISYHTDRIDYEYILELMQSYTNGAYKVTAENITMYIDAVSKDNPKIGKILKDLWQELLDKKEEYQGVSLRQKFEEIRSKTKKDLIHDFAQKYCVEEGDVAYLADITNNKTEEGDGLPLDSLLNNSDYDEYKKKTGLDIRPFQYKKTLREAIKKFLNEDILPLKMNY